MLPNFVAGQFFRKAETPTGRSDYPRLNLSAGYEVDRGWPLDAPKANGHAWGEMAGLCLDHQGHVWAFHRGDLPVMVYNAQGNRVRAWGEGEFVTPHQVRIDLQGHVWLVDSGDHTVREYTAEGRLLRTFGTPGEPGDDPAHFNQPTDVAVCPDGSIYVADGYGNNRIVQFDPQGQFVRAWGRLGAEPGEFSLPHAIARDSRGRLYVADRNNARVQVFEPNGTFVDAWTGLIVPWHIVVTDRDEIYVCGSSPMRWPRFALPGVPFGIPPKDQIVMIFNPEGKLQRLWTFPLGREPGALDWLHAMAVDPAGNLYLGDIKGARAQRFLLQPPSPPGPLADTPKTDPALQPAAGSRERP